ncbi:hypothetical protein HPB47_026461 [Ixodes persulcatus]|uniref:Uncharacterized protein n=1 Tax=Ixodes persulcatus TaxID=34615 RepID=A0AC60Q0N5_IXOPE|nr:hypothetical protein HPB47_026461 [Ixodes persulcatus]
MRAVEADNAKCSPLQKEDKLLMSLVQGRTLVEVGSGPLVWCSLLASRRFRHIVLSDLLEGNRLEINKWLNKDEDAVDWTFRAEQVAALEGYREVFDVVFSGGCLESATTDHESFRCAVCNVGTLAKPGGLLVLVGVGGTKSYPVGTAAFAQANVTENVIKQSVREAGFQMQIYRTMHHEALLGLPGLFTFVLAARKS